MAFREVFPKFLGTNLHGSVLVPHFLLIEFQTPCYTADEVDVISASATYVLFQLPTIFSIVRLLQRQPSSTGSRADVGNVLIFCSPQAGFPVRRHLYKVCFVSKIVGVTIVATPGSFMFCFSSFN